MNDINEQIDAFAMHLIEREAEVCPRGNKRSNSEHNKFVLSTRWLCKKLLLAHAAHEVASTRISRDKNRYTQGRYVPEGISHRITIEGVLDLMDILGYVELTDRGHYDRSSGKGGQTRYKPTQALLDHFEVVYSKLPKALAGNDGTDFIVLQKEVKRKVKDKDGNDATINLKKKLPYTDNAQTVKWRENLKIINDCISNSWADLLFTDDEFKRRNKALVKDKDHDYSPIQLHRTTLRRIFNSDAFDEGGRFYGAWWHNIPSAYRAFITIDGKKTDEWDYSRLHPTILYAKKGLVLEGDAYDIGIGKEHRDIVKQSFNAMLQAKSKLTTPPRDVDYKSTGKSWMELRQLILNKHKPIEDRFFCSMGNRLQFEDSQLAEQVLLHFAEKKIPILPVHDSFIIIRGLSHELSEVMRDKFEQIYGVPIDIGDSAKVSSIGHLYEVRDAYDIMREYDKFSQWNDRNPIGND
nr:hypothetical protein 9 [bacterium]